MRGRSRPMIRILAVVSLVSLATGTDLSHAGARGERPSEQPRGQLVFRGTTSLEAAARRTVSSLRPALSPDRIPPALPGEGRSPIASSTGVAAPSVDAVPVVGEPSSLLTEFDGLGSFDNLVTNGGFEFEPPDQGLCVGNGFVLESINVSIRVFKASGSPKGGPASANAFYGLPPVVDPSTDRFGPILTDPSCLYDPETKRFFHIVLTLDVDPVTGDLLGPNHLDIAVSRTSNPTGQWNLYRLDVTNDGSNGTPDHDCPGETEGSTGPCIGDYPHIGLDESGFFITTNEYALFDPDERFMGAQMYAMSKARLAAGAANVPLQRFESLRVPERDQIGFTLRAANAPGTNWSPAKHGTVFFVSGMVGAESGNPSPDYNAITIWALSNTASLNSATPNLKLHHKVVTTLPYEIPPPSAQRPGDLPLADCLNSAPCISVFGPPPSPQGLSVVDSLDGRMLGTWFAHDLLWFSLGTGVDVRGQTLAGIMYGAVEPSFKEGKLKGKVKMQDYLAVDGNNLIMPSVGLDANGQGYLAFTLVGPDHFPSAAVARVSLGHAPTKVSTVEAGVGPQDGFTGYWIGGSRPRWGDYSYTAVDEQGNVWAGVELIAQTCTFAAWIGGDLTCGSTRGALANFDTWVMELK